MFLTNSNPNSWEERTIVDKHIIQAGLEAVKRGGAVLRDNFGKAQKISYKGKLDLVTDTDCLSEDTIVGFLKREFPEHGILAEERREIQSRSAYRWILDPLDGTTNFAHGYPFFCVSLACELNSEIVWGAVYDPLRDELFTAELQQGAELNGTPLRVSTTDDIGQALLCTGFPYDVQESDDNNLNHFENFIKVCRAIRRDGSAALDLCYVAMGRFDGFWEMKLNPWDIAAGCLLVAESGGTVTNFDGKPCDITTGEVAASNSRIHAEMVRVLSLGRCDTA